MSVIRVYTAWICRDCGKLHQEPDNTACGAACDAMIQGVGWCQGKLVETKLVPLEDPNEPLWAQIDDLRDRVNILAGRLNGLTFEHPHEHEWGWPTGDDWVKGAWFYAGGDQVCACGARRFARSG